MNNLLPSAIRTSEKYDLKGSTYKRKASKHELAKSSPTYKDLDYKERNPDGIVLEADTFDALMKTIKRDCRVLESFKIMDYSLLLSVFNVDDSKRKRLAELQGAQSITQPLATVAEQAASSDEAGAESNVATPGLIARGRSTRHRLQQFSTAMESIQADADPVELEDEDVPPGGIPARNSKGERLLLYMGIIDILQSYRLKKKLEHGFKSIVYDGDTISVHRPSFYAQRFQSFFEKEVFKKISSLQQIKKLPALQHVQSGYNSAIRSPSKKKSTNRQRSVTEPPPSTAGPSDRTPTPDAAEGSLLHKDRPDLIPHTDDGSRPSTSSNAFDPHWSGTTMSSSTAQSSSTMSSYLHTQNKDLSGPLSSLSEQDLEGPPPQSDDPLPPYSELAPPLASTESVASGGARSKQYHLKPELQTKEPPSQAVSAPSVLGTTDPARKSSFRQERNDRDGKKGVRFSPDNSEDEDAHENDELLPTDLGLPKTDQHLATQSEDEYRPLKLPLATDIPLITQSPPTSEVEDTVVSDGQVALEITPENHVDRPIMVGASEEEQPTNNVDLTTVNNGDLPSISKASDYVDQPISEQTVHSPVNQPISEQTVHSPTNADERSKNEPVQ